MRRFFLTIISLLVAVGTFAQRGTCGSGVSWKLTDGVLTISGNGEMDFGSKDPSWEVYKDDITKVVVEGGVKNVASSAFNDYDSIRVLELDEGVEKIGVDAFYGCDSIKDLTLPESIREIETGAFSDVSISILTIPEGLETIDAAAFERCNNLTTVNWNAISATVTFSKGWGPFCGRMSSGSCPITEVNFGKNVVCIPNNLFYDISTLETVRTSGSISKVSGGAFGGTSWLNMQPDGPVYIDKALYTYRGAMTKATSIVVPEGIESITGGAFSGENYLVSVTLPSTMKYVGEDVFSGCSGLGSVTWNAEDCHIAPSTTYTGAEISPFSDAALYEVIFGDKVKRIPDYTFSECNGLEEIVLPSSLVSIGKEAFKGCILPTSLKFGEAMQTIGTRAFAGCESIETIEFNEGLDSINSYAFSRCSNLKSIILPESLKYLSYGAFCGNANLKHVNYNAVDCETDGWSKWEQAIFEDVILESFTIGDKVTRIPSYICGGRGSLTEVVIPASVKVIERLAFSDCSGIESLTIGENVDTIHRQAFNGCTGVKNLTWNAVNPVMDDAWETATERFIPSTVIEKLTLGERVEEIPKSLCDDCAQLAEVTIPSSVTTIGKFAFSNTGITELYLPANVKEIYQSAFANSQLKRVIIPSNEVPQVYMPFYGCNALESILVPDVEAFNEDTEWAKYSSVIMPMVSFTNDHFVYSGKLPETEVVNNLAGYTLQLGQMDLTKDAGTYTAWAEASYSGPNAFTVNVPFRYQIDKGKLTLTPADVTMTYGDEKPAAYEFATEGLVNEETLADAFEVLPEFSTETPEHVEAGQYVICLANTPEAKNYDFTHTEGTLTVNQKQLNVAAVNATRVYGEATPEFELAYEGFAFDDDASSLDYPLEAFCSADEYSDAGEYEIFVIGNDDKNYTFAFTAGVLTVTPAQQEIEWTQSLTDLHVGDSIALHASATSGLGVAFATDSLSICRISCVEGKYYLVCLAAGEAHVWASQEGNNNWQAAEQAERTLTITDVTVGMSGLEDCAAKVYAANKQIVVKGVNEGTPVSVNTLNGVQTYRGIAHGNEHRISIDKSGIYVVNVDGLSVKVSVK